MRAKKLDLTDIRHVLRDRKQWAVLGVVVVPEGGDSHFQLVEEDGDLVDILVEVETVPDGNDITARLGGGAQGRGVYTIPSVGDEVVVVYPSGQIAFMPTIVALLSTNAIPNPSGEGPAENRTVIVNGEVLIHDGSGGAESLVKKTEFDLHKHPTGTGPSGPPDNAPITGTEVLKAS